MSRPEAILLLGPTGSGKTPLGEMLEARGLGGCACAHFDFGDRLRRIAAGQLEIDGLTPADRAFLVDVLERGALLEDKHFPIAEKILQAFIAETRHGRPKKGGQSPIPKTTSKPVVSAGKSEIGDCPGFS